MRQVGMKSIKKEIISHMIQGLRPQGFLYVSVLSTDDSGYQKRKKDLLEVEKNTFYIQERDLYVHYFTNEELLILFKNWKLIYTSKNRFLRKGKNFSDIPYQASIEYLGQKI